MSRVFQSNRKFLVGIAALAALLTVGFLPAADAGAQAAPLAWDGPVLSEGASGPDVAAMQQQLINRGFWIPGVTGRFDSQTRHAVVAFQKYFRQPRTGRLDATSRFVLAAVNDRVTPVKGGAKSLEIDLARQILIAQSGGVVTWIFDTSTGKASTPTPRGNFRIYRTINGKRISKLGELWRPRYFTGGYAVHGSPSVPNYPASHGCVRQTNVQMNFIWDANLAPVGTPVRIF